MARIQRAIEEEPRRLAQDLVRIRALLGKWRISKRRVNVRGRLLRNNRSSSGTLELFEKCRQLVDELVSEGPKRLGVELEWRSSDRHGSILDRSSRCASGQLKR
jgi:hypothetical protein